jgi:hypothetical protein
MSLVDRANELEYVPEEQLIQMSQSPDGQYPQFLVLSEIQRRNQMRRMYENQMAKMNQPSTTVADEAVMEFAGQGAVPMMDSPSTLSSTSDGGLRSMAPIPMSEGKKTKLEPSFSDVRAKLTEDEIKIINQAVMQDRTKRMQSILGDKTGKFLGGGANISEQIFSVLGGGGGNIPIFEGTPEAQKFIEVANIIIANRDKNISSKNTGGITQMQAGGNTALEQSFMPPNRNPIGATASPEFLQSIKERYTDPDGTFNYSQALKDGFNATTLALIAFPEPTTSVIGGGLRGLGTLLKAPFSSKAKDTILRSFGRRKARQDEGKLLPTGRQTIESPPVPAGYYEGLGRQYLKESVKPTGTRLAGLAALGIANAPDETESIVPSDTGLTEQERKALEARKKLQDLISTDSTATPSEKGLSSMDYLTLAQVGGIFGGAKNLGEAAMGLGNLAGQIAETRRKQPLETAQMDLLRAQIAKYEADVANLPLDAAIKQYQSLNDLVDSGVITPEEAKLREIALTQRIADLQGIESTTPTRSYSQYLEAS